MTQTKAENEDKHECGENEEEFLEEHTDWGGVSGVIILFDPPFKIGAFWPFKTTTATSGGSASGMKWQKEAWVASGETRRGQGSPTHVCTNEWWRSKRQRWRWGGKGHQGRGRWRQRQGKGEGKVTASLDAALLEGLVGGDDDKIHHDEHEMGQTTYMGHLCHYGWSWQGQQWLVEREFSPTFPTSDAPSHTSNDMHLISIPLSLFSLKNKPGELGLLVYLMVDPLSLFPLTTVNHDYAFNGNQIMWLTYLTFSGFAYILRGRIILPNNFSFFQ